MSTIKALGVPKIKALGLKNLQGVENPKDKTLKIRYLSCEQKGILLHLKFEVEAKNLKEAKAYLSVYRGDVSTNALSSESVTKLVEINQNGKRNVEITVPISFASNEYYKTNKYYRASITVDGIFALSEGFEIKIIPKQNNKGNKTYASEEDWKKAARELGIKDADLIKAMAYKETFMKSFIGDYPTTMYERHRFYELYKDKYGSQKADELHKKMPDLVNPDGGGYREKDFIRKDGTLDEIGYNNFKFEKVKKMMQIDKDIAIMSASYGLMQVLGEYCNYSNLTATEFLNEVTKSEKFQIQAFVNFIKGDSAKKGIPNALNSHDWEKVATLYNGKYWYKYNKDYPIKLKKYYEEKPWNTMR